MTLPPDADAPEETLWRGRWIVARKRGRWEYVARTGCSGAAVILALDGGHVILVEQYRVPLGSMSLELPAGLIGDGTESESAEACAIRELEEETGYRAAQMVRVGEYCASPGMSAERFTLLRAEGLTRTGDGGGIAGEDIVVHRVPLATIGAFVAERSAAGTALDVKLLLLLGAQIIGG